jgi:hypothetical protein
MTCAGLDSGTFKVSAAMNRWPGLLTNVSNRPTSGIAQLTGRKPARL